MKKKVFTKSNNTISDNVKVLELAKVKNCEQEKAARFGRSRSRISVNSNCSNSYRPVTLFNLPG